MPLASLLQQEKLGVRVITGATTLTQADAIDLLVFNSPTPFDVTLPQTSTESVVAATMWPTYNNGSGDVTVVKEGGDVLNGNTLIQSGATANLVKRIAGTPNTYDIFGGTSIQTWKEKIFIHGVIGNQTGLPFCFPEYPGTIINASAILSTGGTINFQFKINGVSVTHSTLTASTTRATVAATANNTFVKGDYISADLSGSTGSPANILVQVECIGRL